MKKTDQKKKTKTTLYMPEDIEIMLDEIFITRIRKRNKTNRSNLICEAIQLLYQKEIGSKNPKKS